MDEMTIAVRIHDDYEVAGEGILVVLFPLPCITEAGCFSWVNGCRSLMREALIRGGAAAGGA